VIPPKKIALIAERFWVNYLEVKLNPESLPRKPSGKVKSELKLEVALKFE
jgi:hypothetical protein